MSPANVMLDILVQAFAIAPFAMFTVPATALSVTLSMAQ
jgi:hypothetical protein